MLFVVGFWFCFCAFCSHDVDVAQKCGIIIGKRMNKIKAKLYSVLITHGIYTSHAYIYYTYYVNVLYAIPVPYIIIIYNITIMYINDNK